MLRLAWRDFNLPKIKAVSSLPITPDGPDPRAPARQRDLPEHCSTFNLKQRGATGSRRAATHFISFNKATIAALSR
jgi:hypothetical protein